MRYIIFLLLTVTLLQAEYLRTIRIGTYPDEASAKKALQKLQKYVKENEVISKLQQEWDFTFKERRSGKYYITLAEPFRDREVLQKVLDNLRIAYPDIYVTRLKSYPKMTTKTILEKPQTKKVKSDEAAKAIIKEKETETTEVDKKLDTVEEVKSEAVHKIEEPKSTQNKKVEVPVVKQPEKELLTLETKKPENKNYFWIALLILFALVLLLLYFLQRYKKRLEDETLQKMMLQEQLDQSNLKLKNKDKVFSHTSHELRNPISAIMGLSHLLLEESMSQKQKEYVKKIEGSAKYLLEIINDILDLSKMEAGALKIEKREFNLNHVIRHVINIVSVAARENGTAIELDIDHKVPPYIVGDSLRLTQILVNLLSNAVKFTKNGTVVLGIRKTSQHGDMLTLEFVVKDNGIGMTPSQLKNIFNSYTQASDSTAREFGGTGLGLSIVKYLVDIMKGDIHVESKKHHGTTFVLHLKLHTRKEKEKRFYRLPSKAYLNRRVLLVDKSQHNIKKLRSAFSYFNYAVHTIPSFYDTVLDPNIHFDIVVVNKALVDEKLLDIIQEMKSDYKTKFILFSDSAYELDKSLLEKLDIDEHLSRPFTQEDILELLKKVCTVDDSKKENVVVSQDSVIKEKLKKLGKRKILIAEDNKLNHKVLSGILADTEFELVFAEDGDETLEKLQTHESSFDLIILDINMPKKNGYETAMEIRTMQKYQETPILALTADVMQDAINKTYEAGMQGHIAKPIIIQNFYEKLYNILVKDEPLIVPQKETPSTKATKFQELSISAGIESSHHDEQLYKTLLEDFVKMYSNSAEELATLVRANKFQEARKKAMDIKETALHIGAYKLYENVAAMQYEFEKAQRINSLEMLRYYKESLHALLREIKKYLN